MPRHYPAELRRRTCERMLAGEAVKDLSAELGICDHYLASVALTATAQLAEITLRERVSMAEKTTNTARPALVAASTASPHTWPESRSSSPSVP